MRREVEVLNLVSDHPNVAELVEVFEDSKAIYLVLELCKGGELFDRVVAKGTFTERMAAGMPTLAQDVAAGLRVCLQAGCRRPCSCCEGAAERDVKLS